MKKIAISANGQSLEAQVDPCFGRASYFLLVDPETMEFEVVSNRQSLQATHGAGIQAATLVARQQPEAILTGNCGPKAFAELATAGVKVILDTKGTVRQALEKFQRGDTRPAMGPNVSVFR